LRTIAHNRDEWREKFVKTRFTNRLPQVTHRSCKIDQVAESQGKQGWVNIEDKLSEVNFVNEM